MAGGYYNRVIIIGNLGNEPKEYKTQGADTGIVRFSVATQEKYKNRKGEMVQEVQWHNVVCFNTYINPFILEHMKKGCRVLVEGQLKYREYEKDGVKRTVSEVVVSRFGGAVEIVHYPPREEDKPQSQPQEQGGDPDFDDDIPF